jgi:tellurite resistance protein TerC
VALEWGLLGALLILLLAADLALSVRRPTLSLRQALAQAAAWAAIACAFGAWVALRRGSAGAQAWFTGYVLELSLSLDNLFVFLLIFQAQSVPLGQRRKALAWGVLGAVLLRLLCVGLGAALVTRFGWVLPAFGAFLLYSGGRLLLAGPPDRAPGEGLRARLARHLPLAGSYDPQGAFWVRQGGRWLASPLVLVVLMIELSDLVFAVDSIPAVFGVTRDPFLAFSSNVFAILGLRALYFALQGLLPLFKHLKRGLAVVLMLIGVKMLVLPLAARAWGYEPPHAEAWVLGMVVAVLGGSILASLGGGTEGGQA